MTYLKFSPKAPKVVKPTLEYISLLSQASQLSISLDQVIKLQKYGSHLNA